MGEKMKIINLIENDILVKVIQENFLMSIDEAVKMKKDLEKFFKDIKTKNNSFDAKWKELEVDKNNKKVILVKSGSKAQPMKLGKFFALIFPDKSPKDIIKLVDRYKNEMYSNMEFNIKAPVSKYFNESSRKGSCMNSKPKLVKFYNDSVGSDVVKMLVASENGKDVGSALVWLKDIDGSGGKPFVDRVYPARNEQMVEAFNRYSKEQGWIYREDNSLGSSQKGIGKLSTILVDYDDEQLVPYMDTFSFGSYDGDDDELTISNDSKIGTLEFYDTDGVDVTSEDVCYKCGDSFTLNTSVDRIGDVNAVDVVIYGNFYNNGHIKARNLTVTSALFCNDLNISSYLRADTITANNVNAKNIMVMKDLSVDDLEAELVKCDALYGMNAIIKDSLIAKEAHLRDFQCDGTITVGELRAKSVNCIGGGDVICDSIQTSGGDFIASDVRCRDIGCNGNIKVNWLKATGEVNCKGFTGDFISGKWINKDAEFSGRIKDGNEFVSSEVNPYVYFKNKKEGK